MKLTKSTVALIGNIVVVSKLVQSLYEGEDGNNPGNNPGNPNPNPNPQNQPPALDFVKLKTDKNFQSFLQSELNRVNASEKRKNQELAEQLENLRQTAQLTEQEKEELTQRIESLKSTYQTDSEQAKNKYDSDLKKLNTQIANLQKSEIKWKTDYENEVSRNQIKEASEEYKAHRATQIEAILLPLIKYEEALDANGKPTGKTIPMVNFPAKDKEGNPVELKLSIKDSVKKMTEMVDDYGNLFQNQSNSGLNASNNGNLGNGRLGNLDDMTPQDYAKKRAEILKQVK